MTDFCEKQIRQVARSAIKSGQRQKGLSRAYRKTIFPISRGCCPLAKSRMADYGPKRGSSGIGVPVAFCCAPFSSPFQGQRMLGLSPITYHSLLYRLYSAKRSKYHLDLILLYRKWVVDPVFAPVASVQRWRSKQNNTNASSGQVVFKNKTEKAEVKTK